MRRSFFLFGVLLLFPTSSLFAGPRDDVKAINLEKLNSAADEVDPFPVNSGNLLYATNESGKFGILLSKRSSPTAAWNPGKPFRPFLNSRDYDTRSPFIWKGKTLYFAMNKIPDKKFEALRNFDLMQATGEAAPLPLLKISEKEDELFPWVAANGKEFYFSRKTEEGWKLFVSPGPGAGPAPGPIGEPRPVGFAAGFHRASLTTNALVMYLEGPLENGKTGIFRSKRSSLAAKWSDPEPIVSLNTSAGKAGDMIPTISPDGARLYFVSDREGGKGGLDLWMAAVKDLK